MILLYLHSSNNNNNNNNNKKKKKKRTNHQEDFAVPADLRGKIKVSKKEVKCLEFDVEVKKKNKTKTRGNLLSFRFP